MVALSRELWPKELAVERFACGQEKAGLADWQNMKKKKLYIIIKEKKTLHSAVLLLG